MSVSSRCVILPRVAGYLLNQQLVFCLFDSKVLRTPCPNGMAIGERSSSRIFVWLGEWRIVDQLIEVFLKELACMGIFLTGFELIINTRVARQRFCMLFGVLRV